MKRVALVVVLLVFGCGGDSSSEYDAYMDRIADWQAREAQCPPVVTTCEHTKSIYVDLKCIMEEVSAGFEYSSTPSKRWKTSCEMREDMVGNCADIAALAYRSITDSEITATQGLDVRMRVLDIEGTDINHVVTVVYANDGFFYEINNGIVYLGESDHSIIAEFDSYNIF